MKKIYIIGIAFAALGLLIALGPQLLFKVCSHGDHGFLLCHWSAQAELGIGFLIAALGICIIIFNDPKTHLGLSIGIFLAAIIAVAIPHALIGGCGSAAMACRKTAFPALTVEGIATIVLSMGLIAFMEIKNHRALKSESM